MSILIRFAPKGMTAEQYDAASSEIEETLGWPPDGLELHVCFGASDNLRVSEVWESREQLDAFGEKLMPMLAASGIEMAGEPEILEVHKVERF